MPPKPQGGAELRLGFMILEVFLSLYYLISPPRNVREQAARLHGGSWEWDAPWIMTWAEAAAPSQPARLSWVG